jgi:flagellar basal-body rod protein FlgF
MPRDCCGLDIRLHRETEMDPLTAAAASGIQSRMDSLDMLANNMANGSTSGFKVDREFYSTFTGESPSSYLDPSVGDAPVVQKQWTDFAQGPLVPTGNSTDLALSGSGFFAVNGPNGPLYSRNGSFSVSPTGTLVSAEGYAVRQVGGTPIQLTGSGPVQVSPDGTVSQDNQPVGQLELDTFSDQNQLFKSAGSYFENPNPKSMPPAVALDVQVSQGKLESSNTSPAESAVRMVTLLRHFEMLQHAAKIGADMNKQAIEEVARIPS